MVDSRYFVDRTKTPSLDQLPGVKTEILSGLSGERTMMVITTLEPGSTVPIHSHPHEQVGIVLSGSAEMMIGDDVQLVTKGDSYVVPPEIEHNATCTGSTTFEVFEVFCPPREDFLSKIKQSD